MRHAGGRHDPPSCRACRALARKLPSPELVRSGPARRAVGGSGHVGARRVSSSSGLRKLSQPGLAGTTHDSACGSGSKTRLPCRVVRSTTPQVDQEKQHCGRMPELNLATRPRTGTGRSPDAAPRTGWLPRAMPSHARHCGATGSGPAAQSRSRLSLRAIEIATELNRPRVRFRLGAQLVEVTSPGLYVPYGMRPDKTY